MMKIQAVIFDMDGTLLDTIDDITDAMNRVLAKDHFPTYSANDYKLMVGWGADKLVEKALPKTVHSKDNLLNYSKQFRDDYIVNSNVKTKLYSGISDMLFKLSQQHIKLAVLSNKPHNALLNCCDFYLKDYPFEVILGQRDGIPAKPDAGATLEICKTLKLKPSQVVFIGDTSVDIDTGRNAGMKTVGVTWGFRSKSELEKAGADYIIDAPKELVTILD